MPITFSLIKNESIGGLEINETGVLFALVALNRASKKYAILHLAEEPLQKGAITDGEIVDRVAVTSAVKKLLKKVPARVPYCILSIPPYAMYGTILSLPPSLEERRMEEALKLASDFQIPFARDESYCDTEELERMNRAFFLLVAAKKTIIDPYIACCSEAGIKPIAVELYQRSIARAVAAPKGAPTLITMEDASQTTAFVLKDKKLWLTHVFQNVRTQKKTRAEDVAKLVNFYETEYEKISGGTITIRALSLTDEWDAGKALQKNGYRWYGALGAAARGALPRQNDVSFSLMSIGTKEAFRYERTLAFAHLISSVTIGIGIFFIAAFIGAWIFLLSVRETMLAKQEGGALLLPSDLAETEGEVRQFSELLSLVNGLVKETPNWSEVLSELHRNIPDTIMITSLSVTSPSEAATLTGVAKGRSDLNQLKKRLEDAKGIRDVVLPISNLDVKANIPFTLTFYFEDRAIYYDSE